MFFDKYALKHLGHIIRAYTGKCNFQSFYMRLFQNVSLFLVALQKSFCRL